MLRFFNTARLMSRSISHQLKETSSSCKIILYFWEPYPNKVFGLRNKPLLGYFSGGDTGHISMEINYSNGTKTYISIWPKEIEEHVIGGEDRIVIKPVNNSESLEDDIKLEKGRQPQQKIIEIDKNTEIKLKKATQKLENEFKKDFRERIRWSLTNNCATFISNLLYESGIIYFKQSVVSTPYYVFKMADEVEKAIYLERIKTPSYKD